MRAMETYRMIREVPTQRHAVAAVHSQCRLPAGWRRVGFLNILILGSRNNHWKYFHATAEECRLMAGVEPALSQKLQGTRRYQLHSRTPRDTTDHTF